MEYGIHPSRPSFQLWALIADIDLCYCYKLQPHTGQTPFLTITGLHEILITLLKSRKYFRLSHFVSTGCFLPFTASGNFFPPYSAWERGSRLKDSAVMNNQGGTSPEQGSNVKKSFFWGDICMTEGWHNNSANKKGFLPTWRLSKPLCTDLVLPFCTVASHFGGRNLSPISAAMALSHSFWLTQSYSSH